MDPLRSEPAMARRSHLPLLVPTCFGFRAETLLAPTGIQWVSIGQEHDFDGGAANSCLPGETNPAETNGVHELAPCRHATARRRGMGLN
jgi:hypothetical protein